jgi:AraC-like DNA-binding protein
MRRLNDEETHRVLNSHGLDRPVGIAFAFLDPARHIFYDWHTHEYHQLIYAVGGSTQIETARGRHVLPQGRAAWIPAGTQHRTLITDTNTASLYLAPQAVADSSSQIKIVVVSALLREMMLFATRWKMGAAEADPLAQSFLHTLALLCGQCLESELPLFLPGTTHDGLRRAMDYAAANLSGADQAGAAAAAAMSERTFRRAFVRETGMSWQVWLTQARVLTAMGLLTQGRRVTDVAADVGYSSLSAFAKVFAQVTGEAPAQFRQRHVAS